MSKNEWAGTKCLAGMQCPKVRILVLSHAKCLRRILKPLRGLHKDVVIGLPFGIHDPSEHGTSPDTAARVFREQRAGQGLAVTISALVQRGNRVPHHRPIVIDTTLKKWRAIALPKIEAIQVREAVQEALKDRSVVTRIRLRVKHVR